MKPSLEDYVRESLRQYFSDLNDQTPANLYDMVVKLVEKPVLEEVMARANQNQTLAAKWLGLNRNTLRKKLQTHQML